MSILLITCVDVACTHSAQNPNFDSYTYLDVAHRGFGKIDTKIDTKIDSPPSSQQATSSGSASYLVNTMTMMTSNFCLYVSVCVCLTVSLFVRARKW